jgi:peptidoglycan/xylan/chitin deacetylase (PgdA/CDA1 family)
MTAILMYHQVAEISRQADPLGLAVPPAQFDQQMSYLAHHGYLCLSLSEAVQHYRNGNQPPHKSFVLTFDDGYQDFYSNACPIIEKYGFTATVFLVVGQMGSMSNWWGQKDSQSGLLMSPREAQDILKRGHVLGSHSLHHLFLNLIDNPAAMEEIYNSRLLLQDLLKAQVDYFSYPFSETNPRVEHLVEMAGYSAACAGNSGPWGIYHLWRVPCTRYDTPLTFNLKISGWYDMRTALRESQPGLVLRSAVRKIRKRLGFQHPPRQDMAI